MNRRPLVLVLGSSLVLLGVAWFAMRSAGPLTRASLAPDGARHPRTESGASQDAGGVAGLAELRAPSGYQAVDRATLTPAPSATWSFAGRARLGTYGVLSDAPVRVALYAGIGHEWDADFGEPLVEVTVRTGAAGEFSGALPTPCLPATLVAVPRLEQYRVGRDVRTIALGNAGTTDLEPWAYPLDARVHGRVVDEHGAGVRDALVASHLGEARTDAVGSFVLPMTTSDLGSTVRVVAEGFGIEKIVLGAVSVGDNPGPTVVLHAERVAFGNVVDGSGAALAGVTVTGMHFAHQRTTTDAMGRFQLCGFSVDDTRASIQATLAGYVSASTSLKLGDFYAIDALDDADPNAVQLVLRRGATVEGRVVDQDGQPIAGALVTDGGWPNAAGARVRTSGEDGAFELTCVRPGHVTIWARRSGYAARSTELHLADTVELESGAEIRLTPGHPIRGHVVDDRGAPICNAKDASSRVVSRKASGESASLLRAQKARSTARAPCRSHRAARSRRSSTCASPNSDAGTDWSASGGDIARRREAI